VGPFRGRVVAPRSGGRPRGPRRPHAGQLPCRPSPPARTGAGHPLHPPPASSPCRAGYPLLSDRGHGHSRSVAGPGRLSAPRRAVHRVVPDWLLGWNGPALRREVPTPLASADPSGRIPPGCRGGGLDRPDKVGGLPGSVMLVSLGARRIDFHACPNDDGTSPSLAGLPHHAGLGSGFGSSSPSSGASTSSRSHLMVGTLAWPCGSGHHGLRRTCNS
jgi:hypothetical protein